MAPTQQPLAVAATAKPPPPHFVLVPLPAHGHLIPMVALARLLASRGARASLVTTPLNARRLRDGAVGVDHALLEIVELPFSPADHGLPPDCQHADKIAETAQFLPFFLALRGLAAPFEAYVRALAPRPSCIVADWYNSWTAGVASSLGVPRLFFHGPSCFFSLCDLIASAHGLHERMAVADDCETEQHVVPGMPVSVKVSKDRVTGFFTSPGCKELRDEAMAAMRASDGVVVNTFLDLEDDFVACYEAALGKPVWTLGPFCLHHRDAVASRGGDKPGVSKSAITAWLDEQVPGSVVYVSFGSVARKLPKQLFEVGHGLEDSGKPFLWVVKESELASSEARVWLAALEARTAGHGLVVRGWAPQLAVLSHRDRKSVV